jgi:hypothetical protein
VLDQLSYMHECTHCLQVLKEKRILVRGLTHPSPVSASLAFSHDTDESASSSAQNGAGAGFGRSRAAMKAREERQPWQRQPRQDNAAGSGGDSSGDPGFANFLVEWGAVPVGPTSLFKLLKSGECVLLYPGGAAEVRLQRGPSACKHFCMSPGFAHALDSLITMP